MTNSVLPLFIASVATIRKRQSKIYDQRVFDALILRSILAPVGLGLLLVLLLSLTGQLTFTLLFSSHLKVVADTCLG